ncbi:putative transcription factor Hap3/NF-YB family [Helianthus annuus]|nr:putative transcription factor Hap3/NF-YB family [Helianthus annuus]
MSRYESFRRSGFQKSNMKRHHRKRQNFNADDYCARTVMTERKETGPIRPCHIREAYRRLKLEGKIPKRSVPRLFR